MVGECGNGNRKELELEKRNEEIAYQRLRIGEGKRCER